MKSEWEEEGEDRFEVVGGNREKRKGDKFKEERRRREKEKRTNQGKRGVMGGQQ